MITVPLGAALTADSMFTEKEYPPEEGFKSKDKKGVEESNASEMYNVTDSTGKECSKSDQTKIYF